MTVRLLVLSAVRHARDYLPLLAGLPSFDVVGVAEAADAPGWAATDGRALAEAAGLPFLDAADGLAGCDAVLVCGEPARHAELAARAVRAGRHVLVDKPAAIGAAALAPLTAAAADRPDLVVTAVHRLLSPAIVRARRAIDAGGIGLPLSVDAEWIASGGLDGSTVERPELVCDPALSGGGELTNFGWYPLLALPHLTGLAVVDVAGFGGALFDGPHARFGVEDSAVLSLLLEHEVTATVTVARVPAGLGPEPVGSSFRILGSHGHLVVDETAPSLRIRGTGGPASARTLGGPAGTAALRACFAEFAAAVEHGGPVTLPLSDVDRALRVLDAARRSIAEGRPVRPATR